MNISSSVINSPGHTNHLLPRLCCPHGHLRREHDLFLIMIRSRHTLHPRNHWIYLFSQHRIEPILHFSLTQLSVPCCNRFRHIFPVINKPRTQSCQRLIYLFSEQEVTIQVSTNRSSACDLLIRFTVWK